MYDKCTERKHLVLRKIEASVTAAHQPPTFTEQVTLVLGLKRWGGVPRGRR